MMPTSRNRSHHTVHPVDRTKGKPPHSDSTGPLIGAHQSIAGGIHRAFERAERAGCRTLQIFTRNSNQWHARPLSDENIANYKTAALNANIHPIVAHDSYLINLCAVNDEVLKRSREALLDEIRRCETLGIPYLNFHPGSHMGAGERAGISRIIESINIVHSLTPGSSVMSVLETTAGQGSSVGYRFEHLRWIIDGVAMRDRIGVCIDTCHIFAAGYDFRDERSYEAMVREFDAVIGLERLVVLHMNDSKKDLGSRIDRHEHIGEGAIGTSGFRRIMQDPRLRRIPKILETPKGTDLREDIMNLAILRKLARQKS